MTPLSSGVLVKLLDGMKTGVAKPVGEYQTAVLQVTNIFPAQLGEKDLLPTHDKFYIRVSDSSHIMYIMRPRKPITCSPTSSNSAGTCL